MFSCGARIIPSTGSKVPNLPQGHLPIIIIIIIIKGNKGGDREREKEE